MSEDESRNLDIIADYAKDIHERLVDIYELLVEIRNLCQNLQKNN